MIMIQNQRMSLELGQFLTKWIESFNISINWSFIVFIIKIIWKTNELTSQWTNEHGRSDWLICLIVEKHSHTAEYIQSVEENTKVAAAAAVVVEDNMKAAVVVVEEYTKVVAVEEDTLAER